MSDDEETTMAGDATSEVTEAPALASEPVSEAPASAPAELDAASVWQSSVPTPGPQSSSSSNAAERRAAARKGIRLNKLISTELEQGDDSRSLYLHLVDISDGGLRVNGDVEFPTEGKFHLKMATDAFGPEVSSQFPEIRLQCVVAWQKRLLGGMFVSGLKFTELSSESREAVRTILKICSPDGRRLRFRLNRVLGVGIGLDQETRWLYPLALDLSVEGMRVRLDEPLQTGEKFPLQIFLEFDLPTVHMQAEVVWREEIGPSRYQIGLRFSELNEENARTIQDYIDRCLAQETPTG
jgi:c-di-GMP-binding flagellar brake protein YcgR